MAAPAPPAESLPAADAPVPPPSQSAAPTPESSTTPPDTPVRWQVQSGSTLGFATAWSGEPIAGRFERWKADILFAPEALDRSKVTVSIDMTSARTGDAQREARKSVV